MIVPLKTHHLHTHDHREEHGTAGEHHSNGTVGGGGWVADVRARRSEGSHPARRYKQVENDLVTVEWPLQLPRRQ